MRGQSTSHFGNLAEAVVTKCLRYLLHRPPFLDCIHHIAIISCWVIVVSLGNWYYYKENIDVNVLQILGEAPKTFAGPLPPNFNKCPPNIQKSSKSPTNVLQMSFENTTAKIHCRNVLQNTTTTTPSVLSQSLPCLPAHSFNGGEGGYWPASFGNLEALSQFVLVQSIIHSR